MVDMPLNKTNLNQTKKQCRMKKNQNIIKCRVFSKLAMYLSRHAIELTFQYFIIERDAERGKKVIFETKYKNV